MSKMRKMLVIGLVGVLTACACVLAGCFGGGGSSGPKAYEGKWKLDSIVGVEGFEYTNFTADGVVLEVTSATEATFTYFDDAPYTGTLTRDSSLDSKYSKMDGYKMEAYKLQADGDSEYWELVFITPTKDKDNGFWYVRMGSGTELYDFYLAKSTDNEAAIDAFKWAKNPMKGEWVLTAAYDYKGKAYDLSTIGKVKLTVDAPNHAIFYYLDEDPWEGELVADPNMDESDSGWYGQYYMITHPDGQYWYLYFCTNWGGDELMYYWFTEVGDDTLYLEHPGESAKN